MQHFKAILSGLALLFLTACAVPSTPTTQTVLIAPPAHLMEPTPEPPKPREWTNGELAQWIERLKAALQSANDDKRAIKDFVNGL